MYASELLIQLEKFNFKQYFSGIFAADKIPKLLRNKHFIIVNTDESSKPGSHWYCIIRLNNLVEVFDSLGITEDKKNFLRSSLNFQFVTHAIVNTTPLQPLTSVLCGQYVLKYLFERYHNLDLDFDTLINLSFSDQASTNEQAIEIFIKDFLNDGNPH